LSGGHFSRAPRRAVPARPADTLAFIRKLLQDARFRRLPPAERLTLLVGAVMRADGDGRLWPKVETWAADAAVSPSTVKRALSKAASHEEAELPILTREPYLRPDGLQGSTTYTFDGALTRWGLDDPPCPSETKTSWVNVTPLDANVRADKVAHGPAKQGGSAVTHQNERPNGKPSGKGERPPLSIEESLARIETARTAPTRSSRETTLADCMQKAEKTARAHNGALSSLGVVRGDNPAGDGVDA
jgi:hypothetical protein